VAAVLERRHATACRRSADNKTKTIGAGVGGFSILQAESPAALSEVLKGHPHFMAPGATIDVHEFLPLPGL
jgi:hypothetical protein